MVQPNMEPVELGEGIIFDGDAMGIPDPPLPTIQEADYAADPEFADLYAYLGTGETPEDPTRMATLFRRSKDFFI